MQNMTITQKDILSAGTSEATDLIGLWRNSCGESARIISYMGHAVMPAPEWRLFFRLPENPDRYPASNEAFNPLVFLSTSEGCQGAINIRDELTDFLSNCIASESVCPGIKAWWAGYVIGDLSQDDFGDRYFTLWSSRDIAKPKHALIRASFNGNAACWSYDEWFAKLDRALPGSWTYIMKRPCPWDDRRGDFVFTVRLSDLNHSRFWEHNAKRYQIFTDAKIVL